MINYRNNITKEDIFSKISEADIFKFYIPSLVEYGKPFCSELRRDRSPSCSVKLDGNRAFYKDFSTGEFYDAISYVMKKFGCEYGDALRIIANDFKIESITVTRNDAQILAGVDPTSKKQTIIQIRSKKFTEGQLKYWNLYGITEEILNIYKVKAISHYWINEHRFEAGAFTFAYPISSKYKIYQPFDKEWKWISSTDKMCIQGYDQLPKEGDLLFITSSLKDVMTLYSLGYSAIAPSSESTLISHTMIEFLKKRFKRVLVYYDNDYPGLKNAYYHSIAYGTDYIFHPFDEDDKDPSDYYCNHGNEQTQILIRDLCGNLPQKNCLISL